MKRHQIKLKALPCLNFKATTHNSMTFLNGVSIFFSVINTELHGMIMHVIQFSSASTIKMAII